MLVTIYDFYFKPKIVICEPNITVAYGEHFIVDESVSFSYAIRHTHIKCCEKVRFLCS